MVFVLMHVSRTRSINNGLTSVLELDINSLIKKENQSKYVIFECSNKDLCGGLVDRFKGIMNSYAWAKFTNRKLLINITKPCYFHKLMVPNEIDWHHNLEELIENGKFPNNYTRIELKKVENVGFKEELSKIDIKNFKRDADIISIWANREWFSAYVRNG